MKNIKINTDINYLVKDKIQQAIINLIADGWQIYFNQMNNLIYISHFIEYGDNPEGFEYIIEKKEYIIEKDDKTKIFTICSIQNNKYSNLYAYRVYIEDYKDFIKINSESKMIMDLYIVRTQDDKYILVDNLDNALKLCKKIEQRRNNELEKPIFTLNLKKTNFKGFKKGMKIEVFLYNWQEKPIVMLTNKNGNKVGINLEWGYKNELELDKK